MTSKIRLLGIAPYENMKFLMQKQAKEYPDIELTVFVGDLQQGVELARRNFYNDYDVIVSRGGTATKLRERLDLPVVEVPIFPYDIMRAMKLAENVSSHYAIVGFPNVTASAQILCQLMQHRIDIYTIQEADQVESVLKSIQRSGTRAILCDMVAHTAATQLGLDAVLITSGVEGINAAFSEARSLYRNYRLLREENRFLRSLLWNQINHTVVFSDQGELFFSTLKDYEAPILDFLREESRHGRKDTRKHILKQIHNVQYSIRLRHETVDGKEYTAYYLSESRVPSADIQRGIRYEGLPEAEEQYSNSLYGIVGLLRDLQDKMTQINRSEQPVMIFGEDGTCKEQAARELYLQSSRRDHPFTIIDCFMLNEKVWNYLIDYHNSPFAHSGCTIFLKNVDVLAPERRRKMLANLLAMNVARRNRLIFSCACRMNEQSAEAGMEFVEKLSCLTLYLPPIRQRAAQLPAISNMYLSYLNTALAKQIFGMEPEAMAQLQEFNWPHNHSQFQRILQELAQTTRGHYITGRETREVLRRELTIATVNEQKEDVGEPLNLNQTLDSINQDIIRRVLAQENGNQSRTAARLGISRTTLWRLLNR